MSEQVDFLTKIISTLIPATVAECARRFNDIDRASRIGGSNMMELVEKISGELVRECDFDPEESAADNVEIPPELQNKLALIGETNDLNHIQNLKFDLHELYQEFVLELKESIVNELKDSIKMELHMELFMELDKMRSQMKAQAPTPTVVSTPSIPNTVVAGGMPQFSIDIDNTTAVDDVFAGFESIADKLSFSSKTKSNRVEDDLLANNPLFQMVSRGLDRVKHGKAAYTADELIEARGTRFDDDQIAEFKKRVEDSKPDYDEDTDDEEAERWNKLINDKFTSGL
jgi:hypothetical protein